MALYLVLVGIDAKVLICSLQEIYFFKLLFNLLQIAYVLWACFVFGHKACVILTPRPGIKPAPLSTPSQQYPFCHPGSKAAASYFFLYSDFTSQITVSP